MTTFHNIQRSYNTLVFLAWLATGLPMAIMALFYRARGLSLFEVAVCYSSYAATMAVCEIPTGGLADVMGRRKITLLAYFTMLLSGLTYLFAYSLAVFIGANVLMGISRALLSGSMEAWFVDSCKAVDPQADIQRGLAMANLATLAGLGTGLLAGGFLPRAFSHLPPEAEAVVSPLSTTILASLGVMGVGLLAVFLLMKETQPNVQASVVQAMRDATRLCLRTRELALFLLTTVFLGTILAVVEPYWQPFFADLLGGFEGKTHRFGILLALAFLSSAVANGVAVGLSRLFKRRHLVVCILACVFLAVVLPLLARQTTFLSAAALFLLYYFGNGLLQSPTAAYLNEKIPSDKRATSLSIVSLLSSGGGLIGYLGGGYLAQNFSIGTAWTAVSGLLPLAVVVLLIMLRIEAAKELENAAAQPEAAAA